MENLLLALILVYVFAVGYFAVSRLNRFVHDHPGAFPGNKKIVITPPVWPDNFEDDGTCNPWYNDHTNIEELENHEKCDP